MDASPALFTPETVAAKLRLILRGVLAALGAWRVEPALALVLYRRISGTLGQIERMLVRLRAGRLWRLPHRIVARGRRARCQPEVVLPRRFGWLVQAGGYQAAGLGAQLQAVLNTPDMAELLAASAQARRILRPLCRALAVELPGELPKVVGTAGKARGVRLRLVPEPVRVALPRGVLAAARRAGFGKDR